MTTKPNHQTTEPSNHPTIEPATAEKTHYIVNPFGAIHECDRAHAREKLGIIGWRIATQTEITAYHNAGGNQRFDQPIAKPWTPDPDAEIALGD